VVGALLRQLDFHGQELRIVDAELGQAALECAAVRRLLTIAGVWVNDGAFVGTGSKRTFERANDGTGAFTIPRKPFRRPGEGLPRFVTSKAGDTSSSPASGRYNGSPKASEGPAQYRPSPTLYDPRRTPGSSRGPTAAGGSAAIVHPGTGHPSENRRRAPTCWSFVD
jgi:hypothetical protein